MKRYKRGDASDNTYALVYGGVNPDWAIQDPVIVFEGDADWDQVSAKVGDLSPSYTDNYSNDLYRLDGHSIIKTPKYTTLANRKWILSETLLSSWMWDDLFGDWKANESFQEFIGESRDWSLARFPVLAKMKEEDPNRFSPVKLIRLFNEKLGTGWIEVTNGMRPYDKVYQAGEEEYTTNRNWRNFDVGGYRFLEILTGDRGETLAIFYPYLEVLWVSNEMADRLDPGWSLDDLLSDF